VLYLDEPTVGLDVVAKVRIREFIAEQNRSEGTTVLLTTHDIADIEHLAQRVVIIDEGRILYDGDLGSLRSRYAPYREIVVRAPRMPDELRVEGPELVATRPDGDDLLATFRFDPQEISAPAAIHRVTTALEVTDITSREPGVEDVIRQIYLDGEMRR
jgi:ABC-2 type transport system ATP-binding protein